MIELPKTLRAPNIDELPNNSSIKERLNKLASANIVEGYKILDNKESEKQKKIPFDFYAEININNSRLWDLIVSLSNELPDVAALIFGHEDADPFYGKYVNKKELLEDLNENRNELTKDTFIEWGILYNDKSSLIEIFVPDSKYVRFWGTNKPSFLQIMAEFNLQEIENIEFVDEYPKVREALILFEEGVINSKELIDKLIEKYIEK